MSVQTQVIEDKETLKEIHKALKRESPASVLERHTDSILIQLLREQKQRRRVVLWVFIVILMGMGAALIGAYFRLWKLPFTPFLFFIAIVRIERLFLLKPPVLRQIKIRLEQASLQTLLDVYTLKLLSPANLEEAIETTLSKRLATVDTEDLEALSPIQRKQLVRFTLTQVRMDLSTYDLGRPYSLTEAKSQAGTVGFLALATLKQPGAEHISSQRVRTTNPNLKRAIDEYQAAMKAAH